MKTNFYHWAKLNDMGTGKSNVNVVLFTIMRLMGVNLDSFGPAKDYAIPGQRIFHGLGGYRSQGPLLATSEPRHAGESDVVGSGGMIRPIGYA